MLPRANRATRAVLASQTGQRRQSRGLVVSLNVVKTTQIVAPQVAFIVPAKQIKTAVARHLVKRRARQIVRDLLPSLAPQQLYVFTFRAGADKVKVADLTSELKKLLQDTNSLK